MAPLNYIEILPSAVSASTTPNNQATASINIPFNTYTIHHHHQIAPTIQQQNANLTTLNLAPNHQQPQILQPIFMRNPFMYHQEHQQYQPQSIYLSNVNNIIPVKAPLPPPAQNDTLAPQLAFNKLNNRLYVPLYCGTCRMYGCQCFYSSEPPPPAVAHDNNAPLVALSHQGQMQPTTEMINRRQTHLNSIEQQQKQYAQAAATAYYNYMHHQQQQQFNQNNQLQTVNQNFKDLNLNKLSSSSSPTSTSSSASSTTSSASLSSTNQNNSDNGISDSNAALSAKITSQQQQQQQQQHFINSQAQIMLPHQQYYQHQIMPLQIPIHYLPAPQHTNNLIQLNGSFKIKKF